MVKNGWLAGEVLRLAPGSGLKMAGGCGGRPEFVVRLIREITSGRKIFVWTGGVPGSGLNCAGVKGGVFVETI